MTNPPGQPGPPGPEVPTRSFKPGDLVMARAQGDDLVKDGLAQAMRDYAIYYDGAWWLGDQNTYVRVTDDALNHKLDFKAIKLARADQAVARTRQPENPAVPDRDLGENRPTPEYQPDADAERQAAAGEVPPEPHDGPDDRSDDRPDDPGEVSS